MLLQVSSEAGQPSCFFITPFIVYNWLTFIAWFIYNNKGHILNMAFVIWSVKIVSYFLKRIL
jgi:hypothetical protein